tara:strand:- start:81 stop:257 length:177 start_codon:yes stop_codon:yes gene_type:complete
MTRRYKPATAKITATYVVDLEPEEVEALETGEKDITEIEGWSEERTNVEFTWMEYGEP